jgi:purine-cytosine permease-like protein
MENQSLPKIYSNKTVLGFSIFMSSLFGGILLYQNLKDINKNKEANIVLGVSILLTILTVIIVNIPEKPKSSLSYICGFVGGYILTYFFAQKYIPNESKYPKKAIWKPLIIAIAIVAIFVTLIIFADQQGLILI